jgi:ankyrin repeat protein
VRHRDHATLSHLLEAGLSPTVHHSQTGETPLHAAVRLGDAATVRILLAWGADATARERGGATPLHVAASIGEVECASVLVNVARGAESVAIVDAGAVHGNVGSSNNSSASIDNYGGGDGGDGAGANFAGSPVRYGDGAMRVAVLEARDDGGRTPLHAACWGMRVSTVRVLVHTGATVGSVDTNGDTPLHMAAVSGSVGCCRVLLQAGANRSSRGFRGRTPYDLAALRGHRACAALLASLVQLIEVGTTEEVAKMLEAGADPEAVDRRGPGSAGRTPLHAAAVANRVDVGELLLRAGARADPLDANADTPLHLCSHAGHTPFALLLLRHGANVLLGDTRGRTPLHLAAATGEAAIVRVLIAAGAEVRRCDVAGSESLHHAAAAGSIPVCDALLGAGASLSARRLDGMTAYDCAVLYDREDCASWLRARSGIDALPPIVEDTPGGDELAHGGGDHRHHHQQQHHHHPQYQQHDGRVGFCNHVCTCGQQQLQQRGSSQRGNNLGSTFGHGHRPQPPSVPRSSKSASGARLTVVRRNKGARSTRYGSSGPGSSPLADCQFHTAWKTSGHVAAHDPLLAEFHHHYCDDMHKHNKPVAAGGAQGHARSYESSRGRTGRATRSRGARRRGRGSPSIVSGDGVSESAMTVPGGAADNASLGASACPGCDSPFRIMLCAVCNHGY